MLAPESAIIVTGMSCIINLEERLILQGLRAQGERVYFTFVT